MILFYTKHTNIKKQTNKQTILERREKATGNKLQSFDYQLATVTFKQFNRTRRERESE